MNDVFAALGELGASLQTSYTKQPQPEKSPTVVQTKQGKGKINYVNNNNVHNNNIT